MSWQDWVYGVGGGLLLGPGGVVALLCLLGRTSENDWLAFWRSR